MRRSRGMGRWLVAAAAAWLVAGAAVQNTTSELNALEMRTASTPDVGATPNKKRSRTTEYRAARSQHRAEQEAGL